MSFGTCLAPAQWAVAASDVVVQPAGEARNGRWPVRTVHRTELLDRGNAPEIFGVVRRSGAVLAVGS
jgi:hypothetical protein